MARYTGPRTKLSKRVKKNLFLKGARSFSAKDEYTKSLQKRSTMRRRPSKLSEYGAQLLEKQTLRFTYGLMEKQLANLFKKAFASKGDTGLLVMQALERRLDNAVYKAGLSNSLAQARQLVSHGHFLVNGVKCNIPSRILESSDVVTVKENKAKNSPFWKEFKLDVPHTVPSWIDASKKMTFKVISIPLEDDLPQNINIASIVEYYSRKVA